MLDLPQAIRPLPGNMLVIRHSDKASPKGQGLRFALIDWTLAFSNSTFGKVSTPLSFSIEAQSYAKQDISIFSMAHYLLWDVFNTFGFIWRKRTTGTHQASKRELLFPHASK
jgi:hypothetical protein